jgi:hypothetical protein
MLDITRELVEHYLRATGWASVASDLNGRALWSNGIRWINEFDGDSIDDVLDALQLEDSRPDLRFRLGLCAAADKLISSAHATEKLNTPPDDILFALVGEDRMQAHELLRLAGVDPIAWESARKR